MEPGQPCLIPTNGPTETNPPSSTQQYESSTQLLWGGITEDNITNTRTRDQNSSSHISSINRGINCNSRGKRAPQQPRLEPRELTSQSELDLQSDDELLDSTRIQEFDDEYACGAAPIIMEVPEDETDREAERDSNSSTTSSQRKMKGYAKQTANPDDYEWDWDGIEIVKVKGKGLCVRATRDLYPGYRFPYGGIVISLREGNDYRRNPSRSCGRLQEYLVAHHRPHPRRTGRKERCYIDGHPRYIEMEGERRYAWPGIYCSQADHLSEQNAELAELSTRHQPPIYEFIGPETRRMMIIVTRFIPAGELVEIDYRMSEKSQLKRRFGPAYRDFVERKRQDHRSSEVKISPKRNLRRANSEVNHSDLRAVPRSQRSSDTKSAIEEEVCHEKADSGISNIGELVINEDNNSSSNTPNNQSGMPQLNHHTLSLSYTENSEFTLDRWLEGTDFQPTRTQRNRMRAQYPSLLEEKKEADKRLKDYRAKEAKRAKSLSAKTPRNPHSNNEGEEDGKEKG